MEPRSIVKKADAGRLYVVATPIGNLGDLSPRARETLQACSVIAAEDTRHTGTLLKAFGVSTPLVSLHEHNEAQRVPDLIQRMQGGASIALVSDAGTPAISDPGFDLVRAAAAAGLEVVAVPGPCAAVAALSIGAQPTDRFCFEGFLPARGAARRTRLQALASDTRTLVFYESPHRVAETLADCAAEFGRERHVDRAGPAIERRTGKRAAHRIELVVRRARDGVDEVQRRLAIVNGRSKPGDYVDMVATMDTLCAASAWSQSRSCPSGTTRR